MKITSNTNSNSRYKVQKVNKIEKVEMHPKKDNEQQKKKKDNYNRDTFSQTLYQKEEDNNKEKPKIFSKKFH